MCTLISLSIPPSPLLSPSSPPFLPPLTHLIYPHHKNPPHRIIFSPPPLTLLFFSSSFFLPSPTLSSYSSSSLPSLPFLLLFFRRSVARITAADLSCFVPKGNKKPRISDAPQDSLSVLEDSGPRKTIDAVGKFLPLFRSCG